MISCFHILYNNNDISLNRIKKYSSHKENYSVIFILYLKASAKRRKNNGKSFFDNNVLIFFSNVIIKVDDFFSKIRIFDISSCYIL